MSSVTFDSLRRSFELGKLQPVSGTTIVLTVLAGWFGGGIIADEVLFPGLGVVVVAGGVAAGDVVAGVVFDDPRASCIARPMKPPMTPAMMAMQIPMSARIHHFVRPLRDASGVVCVPNRSG